MLHPSGAIQPEPARVSAIATECSAVVAILPKAELHPAASKWLSLLSSPDAASLQAASPRASLSAVQPPNIIFTKASETCHVEITCPMDISLFLYLFNPRAMSRPWVLITSLDTPLSSLTSSEIYTLHKRHALALTRSSAPSRYLPY